MDTDKIHSPICDQTDCSCLCSNAKKKHALVNPPRHFSRDVLGSESLRNSTTPPALPRHTTMEEELNPSALVLLM